MNGFILKNLPDRSCLESLSERYPEMRPEVAETYLYYMRTSAELGTEIQDLISAHGLSPARMTVLMMLNGSDRSETAADIADWCGVSRATISGLVDSLVKDGLVSRDSDLEDRRMIRIKLTKKGTQSLNKLLPLYFNKIYDLFGVLTATERKQLIHIVNKLRTPLENK